MLITIGNMLKTLHQIAPHEQISRLEAAVLRMQRMLASVVPATEKNVTSKADSAAIPRPALRKQRIPQFPRPVLRKQWILPRHLIEEECVPEGLSLRLKKNVCQMG